MRLGKMFAGFRERSTKLGIVLILPIVLSVTSCRAAKTLTDFERVVEKTENVHVAIDSVYIHDSVFIKETADTVYLYRLKTEMLYKIINDTILSFRTDSIPYPIETVREVYRLKDRQKMQIAGFWIILASICVIVYCKLKF